MNTTLLLTISAGSIAAAVLLCVIFNKLSRKEPKQCEINDSMLREMLMQNGCRILDDASNFDWIEFVYQSHKYSIRGCGNFCEICAGILLRDGYYQPELIKIVCESEMRAFTCIICIPHSIIFIMRKPIMLMPRIALLANVAYS